MEIYEAMKERHAVRQYANVRLAADMVSALESEIESCNRESGLHIQLVTEETSAFGGIMPSFGGFRNVRNYIALVGSIGIELNVLSGYYGERIALKAQTLGLNTCWVAGSFSKSKCRCKIDKGEKLVCVIAVGYGAESGKPHKNKPFETFFDTVDDDEKLPDWFIKGIEAAMLAPTAMNQQRFLFTYLGDSRVEPSSMGGFYSFVDLGIAEYHFEIGAGKENFAWGQEADDEDEDTDED